MDAQLAQHTHVVCKPLPAADGVIPSGTFVDASGWRKVAALVSLRYLRMLTFEEQLAEMSIEQPAQPKRTREGRHAE